MGHSLLNYTDTHLQCEESPTKLIVGGSGGLDSSAMETASHICGNSDEVGPKQAIFCGVTTVRLQSSTSSGSGNNNALIVLRKADLEEDLDLATLICQL